MYYIVLRQLVGRIKLELDNRRHACVQVTTLLYSKVVSIHNDGLRVSQP